MKKGWKMFWISCIIIFCLGCGLCLVGVALGATASGVLGQFDVVDSVKVLNKRIAWSHIRHKDTQSSEPEEYSDSYTNIRKLDVDTTGIELKILPSSDEQVHVKCSNTQPQIEFDCEQQGDTLEISTTDNIKVFNRMKDTVTVWIQIPAEMLQEADITNDAGMIYIRKISADDLSIDVGAGEAEIEEFRANVLELDCGAGSITASGTVLAEADVECGVGEVNLTLQGKAEEYSYDLDCSVGSIILDGDEIDGIGTRQSHHVDGGKYLDVDCGVGEVNLSFTE